MFGQGLDVHVEPLLHLVEHLGVLLRGHEGDAKTLGPKAASTPHLKGGSRTKALSVLAATAAACSPTIAYSSKQCARQGLAL